MLVASCTNVKAHELVSAVEKYLNADKLVLKNY
jgi:hypothetical protein